MTFVFETLGEDATRDLKEKVSKFQTVLAIHRVQVIDRAADVIFTSLGGRGELPPEAAEPPNYYALLWKGLGVAFEGHHKDEYPKGVLRTTVVLTRLTIPEQLRNELPEIEKAIEKAMKIYWVARTNLSLEFSIRFPQAVCC